MSKTFASNPSHMSRGRGTGTDRGRGRGTTTRPSVGVGRSTQTTGPSVSANRFTNQPQRDQGRRIGQPGAVPSSNLSSNNSTFGRSTRGSLGPRGRMDHTSGAGPPGHLQAGRGASTANRDNAQQQQSDMESRGQYAGAYTMFSPNEKRRQQVSQMAQKETEAYQQYKQANSTKTYSYVGTVGGGEINQDQARARQANQVRAQKFNRQMKQAEQRQLTRRAEEESIQAKRDEARRKAEQNAQRQARVAPAEEVRRNREAFLARFENRGAGGDDEATPPGASSPDRHPDATGYPSSSSASRPGQPRGSNHNNNNNNRSLGNSSRPSASVPAQPNVRPAAHLSSSSTRPGQEQRTSAANQGSTSSSRTGQIHVKQEPKVFQSRGGGGTGVGAGAGGISDQQQQRVYVKTESTEVKQEEENDEIDEADGYTDTERDSQMGEEVGILMSMFPDMAPQELESLLQQMGSLDRTIELLDFRD